MERRNVLKAGSALLGAIVAGAATPAQADSEVVAMNLTTLRDLMQALLDAGYDEKSPVAFAIDGDPRNQTGAALVRDITLAVPRKCLSLPVRNVAVAQTENALPGDGVRIVFA